MHKILTACLVASIVFTACNSGSGTKRSQAAAPVSLPGVTAAPGTNVAAPAGNAPVITPAGGNAAAPTASNATAVTPGPAAGTNPPHGQPGHQCGVPVGSPLTGQAAPSVTLPTPAAQPQTTTNTPTPASVTTPTPAITPAPAMPATAKGKNPAHGQPGHRCDIAVGAPLDSKPGTGMSASTPTPVQPAQGTTITPMPAAATATPAAAPATNASGARINPPHGQPGHDCSVQVGQPLPSKQ